jgi:hypothetical protein
MTTIHISHITPHTDGQAWACQVDGHRFDVVTPGIATSPKGVKRRIRRAAMRAGLVPRGVCARVRLELGGR